MSWSFSLILVYFAYAKYWNGQCAPQYFSTDKSIPFIFTIKIPPPLQKGVDYGFKSVKHSIK